MISKLALGRFSVKRKVILACAVTGDGPLNPRYPDYPISPAQIADASISSLEAGASSVHIHARDPQSGGSSRDPVLFREIVGRIREKHPHALINLSTGMGATFIPDPNDEARAHAGTDMAPAEDRVRHVANERPDICTLDVTTLNLDGGIAEVQSCVFMNTTKTLRKMAALIKALGVRPELEAFAPGDILFGRQLMEEGLIEPPALFQICMGVKWGVPASAETLLYMKSLLPPGAVWAAFGISRFQMQAVALSTILGGHCRVGLEDNIYLERGVFATNEQLVARARGIIEALGCDVATPEEAREILGIRRMER